RPVEHRTVRLPPARIVGGVAEVFRPVEGELGLPSRGQIPHPEIPAADEGRELSIRGGDARLRAGLQQGGLGDTTPGAGKVAHVALAVAGDLVTAGALDADIADRELVRRD